MKNTAHFVTSLMLAVILTTQAALVLPRTTWAASGNQICTLGSTCTIGEFVYDDSYTPLNTANCQISSRYPNGTFFLNAQVMTLAPENDGWYSHTFNTPSTLGLYRTEVKCTIDSDVIAIDKSFEVKDVSSGTTPPTANEIAAATWSYSGRSLTTFGNLVANIWGYATRTLTGADLSSGSIATKSDVEGVSAAVNNINNTTINNINNTAIQTRNLLERLVNKPIIETTAEKVPDLDAKLKETDTRALQLYKEVRQSRSSVESLVLNWNRFSEEQILDSLMEVNRRFGGENDKSSSKSIFGGINFLKSSWDWFSIGNVSLRAKSARDIAFSLQKDIESSTDIRGSHSKARLLAQQLVQLESAIGDPSSKPSEESLYGKLRMTKQIAGALDSQKREIEGFLARWDRFSLSEKQKRVANSSSELVSINRIPSIKKNLISANTGDDRELKNKGYYLLGIISSNKKLLATKKDSPISNTWLELGSIVFRSLITNPSTLISQEVDLKYYLPPELKQEDIVEVDEGVGVRYDTEKDQLYVSGKFFLGPSETKTVIVKTNDIWVIEKKEIDSLRKQAEELARPLEKTSYFAQGVTLKTDIDVSLDKVELLMKADATPELKIKSYREAQIELNAVREKIEKLKDLASQAGSVGTFFGFVGGAQTLAVWGLMLVILIGVVSITIYMKFLMKKEKVADKKDSSSKSRKKEKIVEESYGRFSLKNPKVRLVAGASVIFLLVGVGVGSIGGIMLGKSLARPISGLIESDLTHQNETVLGEKEIISDRTDVIKIVPPPGGRVNIYYEASPDSEVIGTLEAPLELKRADRVEEWVKVEFRSESGELMQGWVLDEFVEIS